MKNLKFMFVFMLFFVFGIQCNDIQPEFIEQALESDDCKETIFTEMEEELLYWAYKNALYKQKKYNTIYMALSAGLPRLINNPQARWLTNRIHKKCSKVAQNGREFVDCLSGEVCFYKNNPEEAQRIIHERNNFYKKQSNTSFPN